MSAHDELLARVRDYLSNGGLFNPELMHPQDAVRNLIIDLATDLEAERKARETAVRNWLTAQDQRDYQRERAKAAKSRLASVEAELHQALRHAEETKDCDWIIVHINRALKGMKNET